MSKLYPRREENKGTLPTKAAETDTTSPGKTPAEHDERLTSREAAGELLGVSWSSLADYERGLTKVPVDVVCRMADLYKDPSLLNWYCCKECPICRSEQLSTEMDDIRGIALRLMVDGDTEAISQVIAEIAKDGIISDDEKPRMQEAMKRLDEIGRIISELRLYCQKYLEEDDGDEQG